jgi:hypothetical protein
MNDLRRKKNILINIVLCLCSFIFALSAAEYALGKTDIEGFYGYKMWWGMIDSRRYFSSTPTVIISGVRTFNLTDGNCYPSDPSGLLPLKELNPDDGKYWYCVSYDKKLRRQGFNPDRKRSIALVGDSFTFGEGVPETDTLGYLLNNRYRQINFQNRGEAGANIRDIAKICQGIAESGHEVDEVIYFYNLNDIQMSKIFSSQQKNVIDFQNVIGLNDDIEYQPITKFLSKSALFSLARKEWIMQRESYLSIRNYRDMYLSENNRREFLSTMDEIRSIQDMLARRGISFRMVIYPLLHKDMLGRYPFASIHAAIINACRERGITCLDGYEPFKDYYSLKKFAVHPLDYHPNGLSNQKLVDYIYKNNFITDKPDS